MKTYLLLFLFFLSFVSVNAQNGVIEATNSTPGQLDVTFTTSTANGSYAPENIVAAWIQDSSGKFVKTMLVLAASRKAHLTNWVTATPVGNSVDATTGATQSSHGTRSCNWKSTNLSGVVVPDGTYTVKMEMTEGNSGSRVGTFTFEKGPNAQILTPTNIASFSNISIKWAPTSTAINVAQMDQLFSIYPNPAVSSVFISGPDIREIQIYSLAGKSICKSNQQKVDVSSMAKGIYLAEIRTEKATVFKQFIKE